MSIGQYHERRIVQCSEGLRLAADDYRVASDRVRRCIASRKEAFESERVAYDELRAAGERLKDAGHQLSAHVVDPNEDVLDALGIPYVLTGDPLVRRYAGVRDLPVEGANQDESSVEKE